MYRKYTLYLFFLTCILVFGNVLFGAAWNIVSNHWTDKDEKVYEDFCAAIGRSKHNNLNKFIKDPSANPLYGEEDKRINLYPDCADLPYVIRAYVAYKLRLPFIWTSALSGKGGDIRYSNGNRPLSEKDHTSCNSPQQLFNQVLLVNSGNYRMAPSVQNSDTYPVKIQRSSIKPGTIYYDPNGHVAIVTEVTPDGRIRLIDGHPDKSISKPWFGPKFARGNEKNGGGFRRWRPVYFSSDGKTIKISNYNIPDFSPTDQYQKVYSYKGRDNLSYFDYVRLRLSITGDKINPIEEFKNGILEIFEDIKYRAEAVEICIKAGIHKKPHPGKLPYNIYGTEGEWEEYSTPSRDARLKVAFREFYLKVQKWIKMLESGNSRDQLYYNGDSHQLARDLIKIYDTLVPTLKITYINSKGKPVTLSYHDIVQRLFDMSFDPYHSIELRWGAKGDELSSANDDYVKIKFYNLERRLRNQLERVYNVHTGFELGPEKPVDVDIRSWLQNYLDGNAEKTHVVKLIKQQSDATYIAKEYNDIAVENKIDNTIKEDNVNESNNISKKSNINKTDDNIKSASISITTSENNNNNLLNISCKTEKVCIANSQKLSMKIKKVEKDNKVYESIIYKNLDKGLEKILAKVDEKIENIGIEIILKANRYE